MEIVAPANIRFHAAVPSPLFLSMVTPTVSGRIFSLDMVNTRGMIYSFQPVRKDKRQMVARIGFSKGRMIL